MSHAPCASAAQVPGFYQSIIDDVVTNLRETYLDEGVDEQVLTDIRAAWEKKIQDSGVLNNTGFVSANENNDSSNAAGAGNAPNSKTDKSSNATPKSAAEKKKNNANSANNANNNATNLTNVSATNSASDTPQTTAASGTSVITSNPQHKKVNNAGNKRPSAAAKNANGDGPPSKKVNALNSANVANVANTGATMMQRMPVSSALPVIAGTSANVMSGQIATTTVRAQMQPTVMQQLQPNNMNPAMKQGILHTSALSAGGNTVRAPFIQPTIMGPNGQRLMIFNNNSQGYFMNNGQIAMLSPQLLNIGNQQQILANPRMIQQQALAQGNIYTQLPGGLIQVRQIGATQQQPQQNTGQVTRNIPNNKKTSQLDGVDDISSDDDVDDEEDFRTMDNFEDMDDDDLGLNDEENPSVIEDEEPLNSGDDVSDEESEQVFDTDNVMVCQYDKITRSRNRWKFQLKDGIMNMKGKDYIFQKAVGDAEW